MCQAFLHIWVLYVKRDDVTMVYFEGIGFAFSFLLSTHPVISKIVDGEDVGFDFFYNLGDILGYGVIVLHLGW